MVTLKQGCSTGGPRAGCGPRMHKAKIIFYTYTWIRVKNHLLNVFFLHITKYAACNNN